MTTANEYPPGVEDDDVPPGYELEGGAGHSVEHANLYGASQTFQDLGLPEPIYEALIKDFKFKAPSQIQALTLPKIIQSPDRHMIAQGHNGCGKTTCFTIAMLLRCAQLSRMLDSTQAAIRLLFESASEHFIGHSPQRIHACLHVPICTQTVSRSGQVIPLSTLQLSSCVCAAIWRRRHSLCLLHLKRRGSGRQHVASKATTTPHRRSAG